MWLYSKLRTYPNYNEVRLPVKVFKWVAFLTITAEFIFDCKCSEGGHVSKSITEYATNSSIILRLNTARLATVWKEVWDRLVIALRVQKLRSKTSGDL